MEKKKSLSEYKSFHDFWTNYFWYHHKWKLIAVLAILVLVSMFVKDIILKKQPDMHIFVATSSYFTPAKTQELCKALEEKINDINGDGEKKLLFDDIVISSENDTAYQKTVYQKLQIVFVDKDIKLFIMDEQTKKSFTQRQVLVKLSDLGLKNGEDDYTIKITDKALIEAQSGEKKPLYIGFKLTEAFKNDKTAYKNEISFAKILTK